MKRVFVDLEETLIESWHDHRICKRQAVHDFIEQYGNEVELFSFAVWNQNDIEYFNQNLKTFIESEHGLVIIAVHALEDVAKVIRDFRGVQYESLNDVITLHGKDRAFEDFCLAQNQSNVEYVLLDDSVLSKSIYYFDNNINFEYVRCV